MPFDPSCTGLESSPHELTYRTRDAILYALGIGAKVDELDYLYEGRGPKVYPTFGVVPAFEPVFELLRKSGGNIASMVHGAQTTTVVKPLPPEGTFVTTARIEGVYDMKRLVQMLCSTESRIDGDVVCRTEWQLLFRDGAGFGGPHPPKSTTPKVPDGTALAFELEETTSREQALLYRLSGDLNPLHADPEFAKSVGFPDGPILHGLATYGFISRAVIRHACGGDGSKLRSLTAQFRKPVTPGETLRTVGYAVGDDVVFKAYAGGRNDAAVATGHATFNPR
ncbi:MAG TPA: MaoC/PaaZ C-terminal domain-containing protein [Polyangiaceae bacterium]|jgi:acyl dehydratase|nr:MaoC/PaaZ C-terminal domain-containing protein [Polyangiaceae bacterium]